MDSEVITGLQDIGVKLAELAPNIQKKLMRGALRAGLKVTLRRAKSEIHDVSGDLSKSLRITTSSRNGEVKATLKAGGKVAYYAHMVEFGTAAHMIAAKGGKSVSIGGHQYSNVEHPGASARPFMYPALDAAAQNESEEFRAVGAYLLGRINENLPRLPDETDSNS